MQDFISQENTITVGWNFLAAFSVQDFDQLEGLFVPKIWFRALVSPRAYRGKPSCKRLFTSPNRGNAFLSHLVVHGKLVQKQKKVLFMQITSQSATALAAPNLAFTK